MQKYSQNFDEDLELNYNRVKVRSFNFNPQLKNLIGQQYHNFLKNETPKLFYFP